MERILAKALGRDVTQLATEEKQRLLERLLERLAHEIRNPLSSLAIHVQLLEEDLGRVAPTVVDQFSGRLEVIRGELQRLENIVQQFIRLSGPSEVRLAPVDIGRLIDHVCDLLEPEAQARQIHLHRHLPGNLPQVRADADQLTQALVNLLVNALQAVEHQGRVEVRAAPQADALVLEVQDSGRGIPPDQLETIFEPYFTTKTDGTGIGLWITRQIITAHGGTIHAAHAPDRGALFRLRLPFAPPQVPP